MHAGLQDRLCVQPLQFGKIAGRSIILSKHADSDPWRVGFRFRMTLERRVQSMFCTSE